MNQTDLRIAFKMDTGLYPLWAKNHDGRGIKTLWGNLLDYASFGFTKGIPTSLYGRWLEEKTGKPSRYLRDLYFNRTKEIPTWYYYNPGREYDGGPLIRDYIYWLESFVIKFKPEAIREIVKVD